MATVVAWLYTAYIINRTLTVPFFFKSPSKRVCAVALIAVSLIVTFLLSRINLYDPKPNIYDVGIVRIFPSVLQYQQAVWSLFMIVEAFSFAVGLLTQANEQKSHRLEVEAQRDKAQLAQYKAQIKPHFMFNTLNSLYGLFLTSDPKALPSLEKYISMLRYVHSTSNKDLIPISDEMEYIRQYVELQELRLNEMTSVNLTIQMEDEALVLPPMLIVSIIENCFKHGISPVEESKIYIDIIENHGILTLTTKNRIFHRKNHSGQHTGISNCRKRLELIYPGRHSLTCGSDGKYYNVTLSINLNK